MAEARTTDAVPRAGERRKRERFEARLTPEQKTLVKLAAGIEGRSVSDFIVTSAAERAAEVIRTQHVIQLSAEDSLIIADAILNPAPPNEALRAAARLHDELIGS